MVDVSLRSISTLLLVIVLASGIALILPAEDPSLERGHAPSAGWLSQVQREIARREYRASKTELGLQAPNRAHGLRTYFGAAGIRVHDRTAAGSPELVSFHLAGLGRADRLLPVGPGDVTNDGERVEIRRSGLLEWFVNTEMGLEQGFAVDSRPEGDGPLFVDLSVSSARARILGDSVLLETAAGRTLSYSKLAVFDSKGARVAARFETPSESRLRIVVDDESATYPLLIDPLLTGVFDTHLLSDGAASLFGYSVAGAGDVNGDGYADVIVGAYEYDAGEPKEGAAFIYLGGPTGISSVSSSSASAQIESNQEFAYLGISVAGAGDVNGDGFDDVIVGSSYDDGEDAEGGAFIFHGGPAGIMDGVPATAQTRLQADQIGASLGYSVASAGDVNGDGYGDVIVGAPSFDALLANDPPPLEEAGEAYIFLGGPTGIADGTPASAATRLQGDQSGGLFGATVASAGDVDGDGFSDVIVGAWHYSAGTTDESAAFIYRGSASGIPSALASEAATRIESDYAGNGFIVASGAGDVNGDGYSDVIVGLPNAGGSGSFGGAAMVFHGSSTGIPSGSPVVGGFASFIYPDQPDAALGSSVASAGDVNGDGYADVVIGASRYDASSVDEGVAFVLFGSAAGIPIGSPSTTAFKRLGVGNPSALFGSSVAGAGDVNGDGYADVIAGATYFGASDEGGAFVFHGGGEGVRDGNLLSAASSIASNASGFGQSMSGAGDVNGDGYADLIVGAELFDGGENNEGAAFVFAGGPSGIPSGDSSAAVSQIESDLENAFLGGNVSGAGDVNNDGYADVIVGAAAVSPDFGGSRGAAYVFLGSPSGLIGNNPATAHARLLSERSAEFGTSVSDAGDVNGDGFADVVVGAPFYYIPGEHLGAAFVFLGSPSGIPSQSTSAATAILSSDPSFVNFGFSVSSAGDVNCDGFGDVLVGAPQYSADQNREGAAFLFHGSAAGIPNGEAAAAATRLESDQADANFGECLSGAGDVNGDGYADVIVGARSYASGQPGEGAAFVFLGSSTGIPNGNPTIAPAQIESNQVGASLGIRVDGAGDVNGDGFADVIVSGGGYRTSPSFRGAAFIFTGSETGITGGGPSAAATQLDSSPVDGAIGFVVAGLGDVDGDGFDDVGVSGTSSVRVFTGGPPGRRVHARQLRTDGMDTPIQPGGWSGSNSSGSFKVRMNATHPRGRGRVKLEVETCALGIAFGDAACIHHTSASWADVTASSAGVELTETIGGLAPATRYRWRARVLYAPFAVTQAGVVAPLEPAHGPWRRVSGGAGGADLLPEPGMALSIASGVALLGLLTRRRESLNLGRSRHP